MAGGAAGLGAAAMIGNASAFQIQSENGLKYYNSSSAEKSQFNVSPDGVLDVNQIGTDSNLVDSVHSQSVNTNNLSSDYHKTNRGLSRQNARGYTQRQVARSRPTVIINYDDGYVMDKDFKAIHDQHGIPGSSALVMDLIGDTGPNPEDNFLTVDDIREMEETGVEWGWQSHGVYGLKLGQTTLSASATTGDTTLAVSDILPVYKGNDDAGYTFRLQGGGNEEIVEVVSGDTSADTVQIANGLKNGYPAGARVQQTDETMTRELGGAREKFHELTGIGGEKLVGHVCSHHNTGGAVGRKMLSQYFEWARSIHRGNDDPTFAIQQPPFQRYAFDTAKYDVLSDTQISNTLDELEAQGGILWLFAHTHSAAESDCERLCQELASRDKIDVLTPKEAIERYSSPAQPIPRQRKTPETGLRCWWPMAHDDSGIVYDAAGFGNDTTWNGTPTYDTGLYGQRAVTDDSNKITIPSNESMKPRSGSWTMILHIQTDGLTHNPGGKNGMFYWGPTNGLIWIFHNNGQINARIEDGSNQVQVSENCPLGGTGDIMQITLVRDADAGEFGMYINAGQSSANSVINDATTDINPSEDGEMGGAGWNIYDLQIYNRALPRSDLQSALSHTMPARLHEGDMRSVTPGKGTVVTTPDGSTEYRIRVDNSGNVMTDQI